MSYKDLQAKVALAEQVSARFRMNPKAPGGGEFVPELIDNRSGIGSHVALVDLNKDGAREIITSTKRGTFIFWNNWRKPSAGTPR